ncbi:MAG: AMP-binding protein [Bacteroidia bacterium]|nr:AMP-binding protein [Bacteroidia bacterium]
MQLFIDHIAYQIESITDLENIDKSLLNNNEIKAFSFLENWFNNNDFSFQSSGSTGIPKQFIFTKEELIWSATQTNHYLSLNQKSTHFYICLDINLVAGAMLLARAILLKAKVTIINPSSNPFENLTSNHPYNFASLVPMQLQSILNTANGENILNQFENILLGGAPASNSLMKKCVPLKVNIWATYGMTETLSHIALRHLKTENSFKLLPNNEITLSEENTLKIKNIITKNQWLQTNDLAEIIPNGFIILGRKDFIINSGGFKVNALKVENEIASYLTLKNIHEFPYFVGSIPDELLGDKVVVFIEKVHSLLFDFSLLKTYLKDHLKPYEIPKQVVFVNEFYYTPSQKIDRIKTIKEELYL